jgi:hypothetical protein
MVYIGKQISQYAVPSNGYYAYHFHCIIENIAVRTVGANQCVCPNKFPRNPIFWDNRQLTGQPQTMGNNTNETKITKGCPYRCTNES